MLDRETAAVLNIINDISDGAFKIIDADELISGVGGEEKLTKPALASIIRTLQEHDLIKIKSASSEMYCIATTPKARLAAEKIVEEAVIKSAFPIEAAAKESADGAVKGKVKVKGKAYVASSAAGAKLDIKILKRAMFKSALIGALIGGFIAAAIAVVIVVLVVK